MDFFMTGGGSIEWPENSVISEEELKIILTGLFEQTDESITEDDAMRVVRWAEQCRIDSMLLDLVLERHLNVCIRNNEITFFRNKDEELFENEEDEYGEEEGEEL